MIMGFLQHRRCRVDWPSIVSLTVRAVACAVLLWGATASAQQRRNESSTVPPTDLALDNLELVGASEAQIGDVLRKDPGLLVELKRWVAKDAADRGQVVQDSDLSDGAIFTRLSSDQKFRAVATRLLQRYGYLLPKLNPDSEQAHERDLFMQERVRILAAARERDQMNLAMASSIDGQSSTANSCDNPDDVDCQKRQDQQRKLRQRQTTSREMVSEGNSPSPPGRNNTGQLPAYPSGSQANQNSSFVQIDTAALQDSNLDISTNGANSRSNPVTFRGDLRPTGGAGVNDLGLTSQPMQNDRASRGPESAQPSRREPGMERTSGPAYEARKPKSNGFEAEAEYGAGPLAMTHHTTPYSDIPSVYDMYVHAGGARPATLERFGEELFQNTPEEDIGAIPIDLPASPDYVVGPGDGLTIDLWGGVSGRLSRIVDREGRLSLPEVGPVQVNGQTLGDVQQTVQRMLRTQYRDVSADVSLSRLHTVRVYLVGDVDRPGAYDVSSLSTPLNALLAAGGPTPTGSLRVVKHYRGEELIQQVDLYDLLLRGVRSDVKRLEPGDTLLVPPVGAQIRIDGMVRRPAIYELHGETTLAQALDLAGGILPTAALSHVEVQRLEAYQKRTMLSLDISEMTDPAEIEKKLASFEIRDRDEIHIFPIATFNQDAVYLEGHVLRAGRYAYKSGMKLTDLVSSYSDLLPEPATKYAEIIRLNPPDYRPSVESFDLAAALSNSAAAPKLEPLDTVRIFSRYDFENAPTVSVNGAVRRPGTFQTPGQVHFREAIQLSGGITPDASMDSAQVIRIMPDSSLKILSVNMKGALEGDPINNILLQPRDRILIQQNAMRVDPPTVLIKGEVANPGRYPLTGNMRVSDCIQVAGGFKRSAYTQSADLTRFDPSAGQAELGEHVEINIATALAGDPKEDIPLRDGDVLTIRQLAGWNDIGASVSLTGEIEHPGTYGIQPGEHLSSVLKRAGGFTPQAYVYASVLRRPEVRALEDRSRMELIQRIQAQQAELKTIPQIDPSQKADQEAAIQQLQIMLERVESTVPAGRTVIHISPDLKRWEGTPNDVVLRNGDSLIVPKTPNFILVSGAVYNQTAIAYRPGRSAEWYLGQAGGPTHMADKKGIFVIRADGSIVGGQSSSGWWGGNPLSGVLGPGDMVVVPEKALSPNSRWKTIMQTALTVSSIATSAAIAAKF